MPTALFVTQTNTLTTIKLAIYRSTIKTYGPFSVDDVLLLATDTYSSSPSSLSLTWLLSNPRPHLLNFLKGYQPVRLAISNGDDAKRPSRRTNTLAGTLPRLLDLKAFNYVDKCTEITYCKYSSGKLRRATKSMTGVINELCSRNKTEGQEDQLVHAVEEFSISGFCTFTVACEDVNGED
ncbi:uncharacterized protein STEHIDRAFT_169225 [Stereum hirsutum FP-91666 SS1]|uniref:uncharacterized protein n=1 Tax=Stereum hirsutum (strain FP-91666) TaxID=721885 RepID=UPI000444A5AD|nr:uncharacterized protein STEHIDRAFT_169225 [Stereum hirsutum FP-91666 SS1]EIM86319.1 hypothetical protein STEHIDRAFT_169225 [Stereum hirsutum FP-91666 SS1]